MKRLWLTALMAGLTTVTYCQKAFILAHQDKRGFVGVSAGASLPTGHFGSRVLLDNQASMASQGIAIALSGGYRIVGKVGLMVRAEHHQNPLQTDALVATVDHSENGHWTTRADNWAITTLMAGPYVSVPLNRFTLDARLLAGTARASLPGTLMGGNFGNVEMWVQTSGGQSSAMALGGGLSLRYRLGRILAANLNGNYSQAMFSFSNLSSKASTSTGRLETATFSSDRPVSVVSVSAGLSFLFGDRYRPF